MSVTVGSTRIAGQPSADLADMGTGLGYTPDSVASPGAHAADGEGTGRGRFGDGWPGCPIIARARIGRRAEDLTGPKHLGRRTSKRRGCPETVRCLLEHCYEMRSRLGRLPKCRQGADCARCNSPDTGHTGQQTPMAYPIDTCE